VVTGIEGGIARIWAGRWQGTIDRAGYEWTGKSADRTFARGDVIEVRVKKLDAKASTFTGKLEQTPLLEGAALAIDNHTGEVMAMIGGSNFFRSQFNRSTQAMRQVGSLFKPFVYTAAIDSGYTATSTLDDTPASFVVGPNQPLYEPKNYDKKFEGPNIPLRHALEDSRNVPTVRLMDALTPPVVIQYARRLGITTPLPPFLSIAIGSAESTLMEMTSAYTAFPNQGVRMTPIMVRGVSDKDGNVLEETRPEAHEALRADTAYIMTNLLAGVIENGTATAAKDLKWTLAGKTGTTDDFTDAWFIGFDPDITIGVWVGFDQKRTIGEGMQGAFAALPMWMDIMKSWIDRRRPALPDRPEFERPGNIVMVMTDKGPEAYIAGTQPGVR
jgi:penicillin-binding protein 1A